MRPFGATTKFTAFLFAGAMNVSFRHPDNWRNINSEATERQPETPAILQNLVEARKVYMGRTGV